MKTFLTACDPWGVSVERVEVKNLSVAREMVKSLAVEAQASREVRLGVGENRLELKNIYFLGQRSSHHAEGRRQELGEDKVRRHQL